MGDPGEPVVTDVESARQTLGVATQSAMARMLGMTLRHYARIAAGRATLSPAPRRLLDAYLAGYRPPDWPADAPDRDTAAGRRR